LKKHVDNADSLSFIIIKYHGHAKNNRFYTAHHWHRNADMDWIQLYQKRKSSGRRPHTDISRKTKISQLAALCGRYPCRLRNHRFSYEQKKRVGIVI
jgi:hypothetical protein